MLNNTNTYQFIPPDVMHYAGGTWADAAGQVAGTICKHKSANAETVIVSVPIEIPSNSQDLQGAKLVSIEFDYEILIAAATSVTPVIKDVSRGVDGSPATAGNITATKDLLSTSTAATVDQHKYTMTISVPTWMDNMDYYLLQVTFVCPGTTTIDVLGAVARFTFRS